MNVYFLGFVGDDPNAKKALYLLVFITTTAHADSILIAVFFLCLVSVFCLWLGVCWPMLVDGSISTGKLRPAL